MACTAATASSSWVRLAKDHTKETAIASTPSSSTRCRAASLTCARLIGTTTSPLRSMRSSIAAMVRCSRMFGVESQPSSSTTREPWAMGIISSKPLVARRPTRRPVREARVLVTAVVPNPKRLTWGSSASSVVPLRWAAISAASSTPRPISPVVVGALARQVLVPSVRTQSVKVPPTSMPMQVRTASATGRCHPRRDGAPAPRPLVGHRVPSQSAAGPVQHNKVCTDGAAAGPLTATPGRGPLLPRRIVLFAAKGALSWTPDRLRFGPGTEPTMPPVIGIVHKDV